MARHPVGSGVTMTARPDTPFSGKDLPNVAAMDLYSEMVDSNDLSVTKTSATAVVAAAAATINKWLTRIVIFNCCCGLHGGANSSLDKTASGH